MRSILAPVLVLLFAAVMLAPSLYLLEFHLHRAYIERELCVQRDVVESMRTCHGECQLSKRFKTLEQEAAKGFPAERLEFRSDPMVDGSANPQCPIAPDADRFFMEPLAALDAGHAGSLEPVPWA
ncbi:MAG: hypothetical protein IPM46_09185 [Flavobacteriales bacterium]|nr:hypothetical protein [Flavobacteriales bacterium]